MTEEDQSTPRRGRRPKGDRPKTAGERMAELRARKAAEAEAAASTLAGLATRLRAVAANAGEIAPQLEAIADQMEGMPPRVHLVAEDVAAVVGARRRELLAQFVELVNRAGDGQALDRIERRIAILADVIDRS